MNPRLYKGSDLEIRRPISPRPQPRSSRPRRVLILKSGGAPSIQDPTNFNFCKGCDLEIRGAPSVQGPTLGVFRSQGRPINPRPHPRTSRSEKVLIFNSRAPHQSKASPSEFKICKRSDLRTGVLHQSKAVPTEFKICKGFDLIFKGVPGPTFAVQDL